MGRAAAILALLCLVTSCDEAPEPARSIPDVPDAPPPPPRVELADPAGGMTLRLPVPGATRDAVLRATPECAAELHDDECRFHGWIRPLSSPCEDGCTWWRYTFARDRLESATLERSVWDVDAEWAAGFAEEAHRVATEITARLATDPQVDALATWAEVEATDEGGPLVMERRTWEVGDARVTWTLAGTPAHHRGITLEVRVEEAHPEALEHELLDPGLAPR